MPNPPAIPVVDLSKGTDEVIGALRDACENTGFFFLAGHDLSEDLVHSVFAGGRDFFYLPQSAKDDYKARDGEHPFGYQSAILENIKLDPVGQEHPDQREQLKFGRRSYLTDYNGFVSGGAGGSSRTGKAEEGDRAVVWLSQGSTTESWRNQVNEYFEKVSRLGHRVVELLALSLGLRRDYFEAFFDRPLELMNFNYYHATKSAPDLGKFGCGSHTDYGMITILMTDQVPGLQVWGRETEEWIHVEPSTKNHFVVNVGDMLERWTRGRYVSNFHRVINSKGEERMSIAFFFEPNVDSLIVPVENAPERAEDERDYSPVVYGKWLQDKYVASGEVIG